MTIIEVCPATNGPTRCQLPIGHCGPHEGPKHLYLPEMPRVRWFDCICHEGFGMNLSCRQHGPESGEWYGKV
jgi:hypothetical protein